MSEHTEPFIAPTKKNYQASYFVKRVHAMHPFYCLCGELVARCKHIRWVIADTVPTPSMDRKYLRHPESTSSMTASFLTFCISAVILPCSLDRLLILLTELVELLDGITVAVDHALTKPGVNAFRINSK